MDRFNNASHSLNLFVPFSTKGNSRWNVVPCPAAFNVDLACMFLDNAVSHRQSETRAALLSFPHRVLGGEKRIVYARDMLLRDARACSETRTLTPCPLLVETINVPPFGIASFAFKKRFRNTCCSFPALPYIVVARDTVRLTS